MLQQKLYKSCTRENIVVLLHEDCRGVLPISLNVSTCVKLCAYRNQFQCIRYSATELPIYTTCNVAQVVHTQQFCKLSRKLYFCNLHFFHLHCAHCWVATACKDGLVASVEHALQSIIFTLLSTLEYVQLQLQFIELNSMHISFTCSHISALKQILQQLTMQL